MDLRLPESVVNILSWLEEGGFSVFVAGGAVRDMLMEKTPHDYDIATSARPEDTKALFKRTIDTGIKHGTVTVVENKTGYEVTTYRRDGEYADGRHPKSVSFVNKAREDCARRDFTINAMMYNPREGILDYFGGQTDIKNRIIRCVGDPEQRFKEDALRMLRAVRFSAALSFRIEDNTWRAIKKCAVLIKKVSGERILEEINKILLSENPDYIRKLRECGLMRYIMPELERCFGEPQKNKYHIYDVGEHIMHTLKGTPADLTLRWAALMHDIGKPCCSSTDQNGIIHFYGHHRESCKIAVDLLHRLRMDNDTIHDISVLVENHDVRIESSPPAVKRMMSRTGETLFEKLLLLQTADNMAKNPEHFPEKKKRIDGAYHIYKEILAERQPYLVSHLAVNGKDLIRAGYRPGREIGDALKRLIDEVIINPELNNREYLLKRAKEYRRKRKA
ncbi:MAG: HD domain-containing protein [Firmicutes bacterium]|nr:HD domain-containing protein [Bacillota bacterium]